MATVTKFMFPTPTLSINLMTIWRPNWTPESEIKTQHMVAINQAHHSSYLCPLMWFKYPSQNKNMSFDLGYIM